jgi:glutathione synthase/RimK-type ligase-like ATP-grasp enzyme
MRKVYLVSSTEIIKLESESIILSEALKQRGIESELVCWDDPDVDWGEADLSIIRSTSDYAWRVEEFLDWVKRVEEETTLWNPGDVIRWNHHKGYLLELQERGVPIPPTIFVEKESEDSLRHHLDGTGWREIVLKPAITVGGFGLKKYKVDDAEAEEHLKRLTKQGWNHHLEWIDCYLSPRDVLIQEFLPEIIESGEASLFFIGVNSVTLLLSGLSLVRFLLIPGMGRLCLF